MTPVPLAPPVALRVVARRPPASDSTSVSEPGTNAAGAFSASSSSMIRDVRERLVVRLQAQRVAQRVARRRDGGRVLRRCAGSRRSSRRSMPVSATVRRCARPGDRACRPCRWSACACRAGDSAIGAVVVEPLRGARDVGQRGAVLRVGVELRPVRDDQVLVRRRSAPRRRAT